jgi:hypothetical protein
MIGKQMEGGICFLPDTMRHTSWNEQAPKIQ